MRKKLLALPLFFALLLVPIMSVEEEPVFPQPYVENGVFFDPLIPGIEPIYVPVESVSLNELNYGFAEAQSIQVNVLLAGDEEFLSYAYETPSGWLGAFNYAMLQIGRASNHFTQRFDIKIVVVGTVSWHSDATSDVELLYEAISETGFEHLMGYGNYVVHFLIAWSAQLQNYAGIADPEEFATIIRPTVYWTDDNVVQHEVSHLYNAEDGVAGTTCYNRVCVMSNQYFYVEYVYEDGATYYVGAYVPRAVLTNSWCEDCYATIYNNRFRHLTNPCPSGGC